MFHPTNGPGTLSNAPDKQAWLDEALPACPSFMSAARDLDQFYTCPSVAERCHHRLLKLLEKESVEVAKAFWLEPSAGARAFYTLMPSHARHGVDLDKANCGDGVAHGDFLKFEPLSSWLEAPDRPVITEGNPPFGKNSSLAIKFFNHAAKFSSVIAFIVPMTFRKESVQARLDRNFELLDDKDLDEDSFVFEGEAYDVPCCFQVWFRRDGPCRAVNAAPLEHKDFKFVPRDEATIAFRRVGGLAGKFFTDFESYANASHYFLKPSGSLPAFMRVLSAIDWSAIKRNNAGNPSISKRELVREYTAAKQRLAQS